MSVTVVAFLVSAVAAQSGGLVDYPIAGDVVTYLDSETWTADTPGLDAIRATVPGDLITDLQTAGLIGDPLYELQWLNASLWDSRVWTYRRSFETSAANAAAIAAGGDVLLSFDGIKMSATIALNGITIAHTTDQFLRYTVSLKASIRASAGAMNELTVVFDSKDETTEGRWMACTGGWVSRLPSVLFLHGSLSGVQVRHVLKVCRD